MHGTRTVRSRLSKGAVGKDRRDLRRGLLFQRGQGPK